MAEFTPQAEQTVYIGSPYQWTQKGVRVRISEFQESFAEENEEVSAITYDGKHHLFCMRTKNAMAVKIFSKQLHTAIMLDQHRETDHTEELLMSQIPGTAIPEELNTIGEDTIGGSAWSTSDRILPDLDQDSDDTSDESSLSGSAVLYWQPRQSDITILTNEIAKWVQDATDCFLYTEHDLKRVKIVNGNIYAAQNQLINLEPLMELLNSNRNGSDSNISPNLISFTSMLPGTAVTYVPVVQRPHHDRIMVPNILHRDLEKMLIGEERVHSKKGYITPDNLVPALPGTQSSNVTNHSQIWAYATMPAIGLAENARPNVQGPRALHNFPDEIPRPDRAVQPTVHIDKKHQIMVTAWTQSVDPNADPMVAAEKPSEPEAVPEEDQDTAPTTRYVESDSDSDTELPKGLIAKPETLLPNSKKLNLEKTLSVPVVFQRQPFAENAEAIRRSRANRKMDQTIDPSFPQPDLNTGVYTRAVAFFKDVPQDENVTEQMDELPRRRMVQGEHDKDNVSRDLFRKETRGFSHDGANDSDGLMTKVQATNSVPSSGPAVTIFDDFDPQAYGASTRSARLRQPGNIVSSTPDDQIYRLAHKEENSSKVRGRIFPAQIPTPGGHLQSWTSPAPVSPLPGAKWQGNRQKQNRRHHTGIDRLVDYEDTEARKEYSIEPPPGFTVRDLHLTPSAGQHLLDSSIDNPIPSIMASIDRPDHGSEGASTSSSSGCYQPRSMDYKPQVKVSRPDLFRMRDNTLNELMAAKRADKGAKTSKGMLPHHKECIAEEGAPKVYNTMNLRAPNPGKKRMAAKGNVAQKSSKTKAEEFIQTEIQAAKSQQTQSSHSFRPNQASERVSVATREAAKANPMLAALHISDLSDSGLSSLSESFMTAIKPAIEAARFFPGQLELEMQIGQLLIRPTAKITLNKAYEIEKWNQIFNSNRVVEAKFTNIVTNHGPDVDGILGGKTKKWKTWAQTTPGPTLIHFDFVCSDNTGRYFTLTLRNDSTYFVHADRAVVTRIGIHCPGRTWDTCAVLHGLPKWQDSMNELKKDFEDFISSLYVKSGTSTIVYFRQPRSNGFTVSSVVVRRTSLHDSQVPGGESLQLRLTEVKTLLMNSHKQDKTLHVAFEHEEHNSMTQKNLIHYEVAVVDKDFNEALRANNKLVVGEEGNTAASDLLSLERVKVLLGTALRLVDKIDWVGEHNYGTLVQIKDAQIAQQVQLARTFQPSMIGASQIRPLASIDYSGRMPSTDMISTIEGPYTEAGIPIRGIRTNTLAQVYHDSDGNVFRLGAGGARIPISQANGSIRTEIGPSDSASQYGVRQRGPRRAAYAEKPADFW